MGYPGRDEKDVVMGSADWLQFTKKCLLNEGAVVQVNFTDCDLRIKVKTELDEAMYASW